MWAVEKAASSTARLQRLRTCNSRLISAFQAGLVTGTSYRFS
jgi:hypothetical protein